MRGGMTLTDAEFKAKAIPAIIEGRRGSREGWGIRCGCGGQVSCGGEIRRQIVTGFGFRPGSSRLSVDRVREKTPSAYDGFCLKCGKAGYFVVNGSL